MGDKMLCMSVMHMLTDLARQHMLTQAGNASPPGPARAPFT